MAWTCKHGHVDMPYISPRGYRGCLVCRREATKRCQQRHPGKHRQSEPGSYKLDFGGNREAAIQRDGEACVKCGMTREQHKAKYGRDITVDHIDGRGSNVPKSSKNNALGNLQTLCLSCHRRKDAPTKLTHVQAVNIRHCRGSIGATALARMYGISQPHVYYIWNNKVWI